jgi:hypothetical protein
MFMGCCARSRVGKGKREKGKRETVPMTKVIECAKARYEVQDVEFGKVYKWRPERIVIECQCGERFSLSASMTSCVECGTDHELAVKEASTDVRPSDQTLHPWRYYYSEEREEDGGLPFWDAPPNLFSFEEGSTMRTEDVELGMFVQVHRGFREADLRDRIGTVRQRFWNHSYSPFEVQFVNKQSEVLWASEFEEVQVFYEHYG